MTERARSAGILTLSAVIGGATGAVVEVGTPWFGDFLGISAVGVFGIGLAVVEGPTLISAIVLARRVTRNWVRSALQASSPFLGFFAYLVAYGVLRHPPFNLGFL
ncbi:MAG TPA: hypothetical protein VEY07_08540 [Thermoplasmata archaeon]|nr:hypothetical protein [Thermoplasmata archaeon]